MMLNQLVDGFEHGGIIIIVMEHSLEKGIPLLSLAHNQMKRRKLQQ